MRKIRYFIELWRWKGGKPLRADYFPVHANFKAYCEDMASWRAAKPRKDDRT